MDKEIGDRGSRNGTYATPLIDTEESGLSDAAAERRTKRKQLRDLQVGTRTALQRLQREVEQLRLENEELENALHTKDSGPSHTRSSSPVSPKPSYTPVSLSSPLSPPSSASPKGGTSFLFDLDDIGLDELDSLRLAYTSAKHQITSLHRALQYERTRTSAIVAEMVQAREQAALREREQLGEILGQIEERDRQHASLVANLRADMAHMRAHHQVQLETVNTDHKAALASMSQELSSAKSLLDTKVTQLLRENTGLREENQILARRITQLEQENAALKEQTARNQTKLAEKDSELDATRGALKHAEQQQARLAGQALSFQSELARLHKLVLGGSDV